MRTWRNRKVREQKISTGDMVLRRKTRGVGKLEEKWEGPFLVSENKRRDLQIASLGRRRGSLLMESAQVADVLALRISVSSIRYHHF
jgi:hypothetical protein